jgi:hypothetical protein
MNENMYTTSVQQRSRNTISMERDTLFRMAKRYAGEADFCLCGDDNVGFTLSRWFEGDNGAGESLTFFEGLTLEVAIAICAGVYVPAWVSVDYFMNTAKSEGAFLCEGDHGDGCSDAGCVSDDRDVNAGLEA